MNKDIQAKLEKIKNLPTIPAVIKKLRVTISNPNADAARISKIIENDPAMMTRILKIVNSAFYGGIEPITSVQLAVARIGFSAISNIALSTFVFSSFDSTDRNLFDRQAFWKHCILTGIAGEAAYKLAPGRISRTLKPDIIHLAGLLHDIGKIVFEQHFHREFSSALKVAAEENIPLFMAERKTLNTDHCEVGAWLADRWNIDAQIRDVILLHHDPEQAPAEHQELTALCHVANCICHISSFGESGDSAGSEIHPWAWDRIGITEAQLPEINQIIEEESEKLNTMLSLA